MIIQQEYEKDVAKNPEKYREFRESLYEEVHLTKADKEAEEENRKTLELMAELTVLGISIAVPEAVPFIVTADAILKYRAGQKVECGVDVFMAFVPYLGRVIKIKGPMLEVTEELKAMIRRNLYFGKRRGSISLPGGGGTPKPLKPVQPCPHAHALETAPANAAAATEHTTKEIHCKDVFLVKPTGAARSGSVAKGGARTVDKGAGEQGLEQEMGEMPDPIPPQPASEGAPTGSGGKGKTDVETGGGGPSDVKSKVMRCPRCHRPNAKVTWNFAKGLEPACDICRNTR